MVHRVWLLADCLPTFDVAVTLKHSLHHDKRHWNVNDVFDITALNQRRGYDPGCRGRVHDGWRRRSRSGDTRPRPTCWRIPGRRLWWASDDYLVVADTTGCEWRVTEIVSSAHLLLVWYDNDMGV